MQDWWQTTFPGGRQTLTIRDANDRPVSIAYGEKGSGQPLFLVHGIASWSYCWQFNIDALAEKFRVICFDAKNSGFSDKPPYPDPPAHKVVELARIMQALCDQPAIVVAESLGALVTLATVQAYPTLFDRLVLLNVPVFVKQLPYWGMRLLAELPLPLVQAIDQWRLVPHFKDAIRQVVYGLRAEVAADAEHISPEYVYWITYPHIELPGTITKLVEEFQLATREIRQHAAGQPSLISDVQKKLDTITSPTLILWSEHDRWFPTSHGEQLRDRLPNAQFKIIPNCGHYAAGGQPQFVNQAILSFLESELIPS